MYLIVVVIIIIKQYDSTVQVGIGAIVAPATKYTAS